MSSNNYVHVHHACLKCEGCIHECVHQPVITTTTTEVTDLVYYDLSSTPDVLKSAHKPPSGTTHE